MKKLLSVLLVVMMLMSLSATAFAAGQGSPDNVAAPPVVEDKEIAGEGTTADGAAIKVEVWDAKEAGFKDEKAAVEEALKSEVFEKLKVDPKDFAGTMLVSLVIDDDRDENVPLTTVFFLDEKGVPALVLYFDGEEWFEATVEAVEGEENTYELTFGEKGSESTVKVVIEDKEK